MLKKQICVSELFSFLYSLINNLMTPLMFVFNTSEKKIKMW